MTYEHIELHVGPRFARLTLNRPDRRNALSRARIREMLGALDEISEFPTPVETDFVVSSSLHVWAPSASWPVSQHVWAPSGRKFRRPLRPMFLRSTQRSMA